MRATSGSKECFTEKFCARRRLARSSLPTMIAPQRPCAASWSFEMATSSALPRRARDAIRTQWKEVPQVSNKEIFSYLKNSAEPSSNERFRREKGSVADGLAAAAHRLEATYNVAYIAHAPLEPRSSVAQFADGKLTVWTGT